jgi:PAS domain S-box-containing protein
MTTAPPCKAIPEHTVTEDTRWTRELQFDQLVSGIADYAVFLLDRDGNVVTWNEGAERIKGYTRAEIIGRHFSIFYTPEDRAAGIPQRALDTALNQGKFEAEAWRVRKDGTRFFASVVIDAVKDTSGRIVGFAKITRDMTERRAMEAQLRQAQKMEAIGQLTGGVAHDFNNLLTIIIGNLDVLSRERGDSPRRQRAIEHAMQGAQRAATLTQQLLAFSRRQALQPKSLDVNGLVSNTADMLSRLLGENIAVKLRLAPDIWHVRVDGHQLESALVNLAVNARDAMPDGGTLTITTCNATLGETDRLRFDDVVAGDYVIVSVSDTGTGMSSDVLEHAFEPFYTTKPQGKGTGLGLSQIYGFARQSEGTALLTSAPGHGTTVALYLPRSTLATEGAPVEAADPAKGNESILLVEDQDDVRTFAAETLREHGFEVMEASEGPSALHMLRWHARVDLLLTDVGLPGGINGRQLAEQARELHGSLRILFMTGYARETLIQRDGLQSGVGLLRKPFAQAELVNRVRELLDTPVESTSVKATALIVEDEPLLREMLSSVLKGLGFLVTEAGSAAEAAEIIDHTHFDVAIVDQSLGDGLGEDVARRARQRHAGMPLMLATGHARSSLKVDDLAHAGAFVFLAKPYTLSNLSRALEELGVSPAGANAE